MSRIPLKEHQVVQKAAFRKWVGFPARSAVPARGARGTIVSATGTGKTIMAAASALECFPGGRILVTVPTLDLLVQTAGAWRLVGHRAPMVAVCSLDNDPVLNRLGVRTTTNPIQLALWAGKGPVVVLATYASLVQRPDPDQPDAPAGAQQDAAEEFLRRMEALSPAETEEYERQAAQWLPEGVTLQDVKDLAGPRRKVPGPLEAALAGGERLYGQQLSGFDLAIVDEAHSTAGDLGRPWAAIHDNERIPADFRLYLTATPRMLAAPRPRRGAGVQDVEIASMADDPDGTYGAWLPGAELGLSEAIERGILAGFEIDVLEIRDPSPVLVLSEEAQRGRRMALLQAALLEHAARWNLRTVMTFHQRVEEARAFAEKLPVTAGELYDEEPTGDDLAAAEELPESSIDARFYELETRRHVPPDRVWSQWLCGDHLVTERRETLRQFANGIDASGRRVHRAFLASCRVLGEGVDITGERGVEAICFADTRGSQVEIMQNIGRALRPNRDGSTKTARVIVPVFLEPGEDPTDMTASASYRPLAAVLQGLRSHDERLVEQLASRALTRGPRTVHLRRDEHGRIISTGQADSDSSEGDGDGQERADAAAESALLHFSSPRDAATIAAFLRARIYRPESLVWLEGYQARLRWRAENGITGPHTTPYDTEIKLGITMFPVGRWEHQQRRAYRTGDLDAHRIELLEESGMVWEPGEEAWERKLGVLRSFHRAHGHLAPRQDAVWADVDGKPVNVGQLAANLRRPNGLGKNPDRAAVRAEQLTAIDEDWNCPWPLDWQRHHRHLTAIAADEHHGLVPDIAPGVTIDDDDIGTWLQRQTQPATWAQLLPEQRRRLTSLGITPAESPSPAPAAARTGKGPTKAQQAFQRGVTAFAQWIEREGVDRPIPRSHIERITVDGETVEVRLGVWKSNTRSRIGKLTAEQRQALRELGAHWA